MFTELWKQLYCTIMTNSSGLLVCDIFRSTLHDFNIWRDAWQRVCPLHLYLTYSPKTTGTRWWDRFHKKLVKTFLVHVTELCTPQVLEKNGYFRLREDDFKSRCDVWHHADFPSFKPLCDAWCEDLVVIVQYSWRIDMTSHIAIAVALVFYMMHKLSVTSGKAILCLPVDSHQL